MIIPDGLRGLMQADSRDEARTRWRVVIVLAAVLALDSADSGAVSASTVQLQHGLHIGRADIGLMLSIVSIFGALAALPAGMLVDRVNRTRLLTGAVVLWGGASLLAGLATSFVFLAVTRIGLGVITAVAGPATASLVGDYMPGKIRGRIWGYVLTGELVGTGVGLIAAGDLAVISWRLPFLVLSIPAAAVAVAIWRLDEPPRSDPDKDGQQRKMSLPAAVRAVLRVRTNVILIVASALGSFFFAGLRGFAVQFAEQHYGVSQPEATGLTVFIAAGAVGGLLCGGRLADRLQAHGRPAARLEVTSSASLLAGLLFVPALLVNAVLLAMPLLICAAACLGAANPPMDAARLDIMPPRLWGRAEAVRTVLRTAATAAAPVSFGLISVHLFTGRQALQHTFLLAISSLWIAALIVLLGRGQYQKDVEAARRAREHDRESASPGRSA